MTQQFYLIINPRELREKSPYEDLTLIACNNLFKSKISLCSWGWLGTYSVDQGASNS